MFGIEKIEQQIGDILVRLNRAENRLYGVRADSSAANLEMRLLRDTVAKQSRLIHALAEHLGVRFEDKRIPDPTWVPTAVQVPTIEVLVCVPKEKNGGKK